MGIVRKTKSVDMLLDEFKKNPKAICAVDLIDRLNAKLNKTTIYRVLVKLEEDGALHSFLDKNGIKWYAKCDGCSVSKHKDAHPHFQCLICGKVDCVKINLGIPEIPKREVIVFQTLIQGKCENCLV